MQFLLCKSFSYSAEAEANPFKTNLGHPKSDLQMAPGPDLEMLTSIDMNKKLFFKMSFIGRTTKMYSTKLTVSHSICSELTPQKYHNSRCLFVRFCYIQKALLLIKVVKST